MIGNTLLNRIMYADDLVVLSPSSAGLQQLLNVCSLYDIKYNATKSVVLICRAKENKCLKFPGFKLSDNNLQVRNKIKYFGYFITE